MHTLLQPLLSLKYLDLVRLFRDAITSGPGRLKDVPGYMSIYCTTWTATEISDIKADVLSDSLRYLLRVVIFKLII